MDLNNTVIPAITKKDGIKIVAFYKKHGYKTKLQGTNYKNINSLYYYYGVSDGEFDNFSDCQIKRYNLTVLDISIIDKELDI
jgi:hypothetical protein